MSWLDTLLNEGERAARLRSDLPYFAEHCLKLRPKAGSLAPFVFNPAQLELHRRIEEQKAKTGRVRAIILKARQLGISTYLSARFFHRCLFEPGLRTFILGHERRASTNLFEMVKRFYEHLPEDVRPATGTFNAETLLFNNDSGYVVSVATLDGAGRSATAQLLHASEAAFWPDLETQIASLFQIVPDVDGSEAIIESTANGYNDFYKLWRSAEAGASEWLPIFLPWSLDPAYRKKPDEDFAISAEETELKELYGLDDQQLTWRRAKQQQLGERLPQEFPLIASEAFISSTFDSFIPPALVIKARRERIEEDNFGWGLIVGVDPAGMGPDRTSIAWRRGRRILKVESRRHMDTMEVAGWVQKIIREDKPERAHIDVGGLGVGVYDRLREQGVSCSVVNAVSFGGKPNEPPPLDELGNPAGGPANRRAELWQNMKSVLEEGRFALPDSDSLQADLISPGYKYDSAGRLLIESKQDMRKRGVPSPDEADAVALCFSEPGGVGYVRTANFSRDLREIYGNSYQ
jgi:hypothetical protein